MKCIAVAVALVAGFICSDAVKLRASVRQEPDTACGKGFDNLVKGSQDYYRTA
eukprot:CAMPEP_0204039168 /NCGR_PEP_ID=MMETSP0360-20130528/90185_1 /ASSEMBLY_ACC=CAM_ASM_000342 /TAXON_ID=268821 /ORGANISM="Scrippsiella Hangoei, Strain SHTV-5" /LENGTH=52 /DNA_ID=CAMNT_0050985019 /DNA_START=61 /DNA_END=215 /DNA_ORIENTATION=+